ncbi:50S ribosomal protein L28 [Candidatus Saccharibacteria bacterium]|nr:50S ribosomal protein L28 [Candidatus Saccharibacteria bacterium]
MAYACDICNKGKQFGNSVPFSLHKTRKVWKPNLQRHTLVLGTTKVQAKLCTSCIRTLAKYEREALAKATAETTPAEATA